MFTDHNQYINQVYFLTEQLNFMFFFPIKLIINYLQCINQVSEAIMKPETNVFIYSLSQ